MLKQIVICSLVLFINCKDTSKKLDKTITSTKETVHLFKLTEPEIGSTVMSDTVVRLKWTAIDPNTSYTKIELYVDGKKMDTYTEQNDCLLNTKNIRLGVRQFSIKYYQDSILLDDLHFALKVQSKHMPTKYTYEIIKTYPHDTRAYTQGLFFYKGLLYEGTGLTGQSSLRKVNLTSGKVIQQVNLDPTLFGEGICLFKNKIIQLTWQNQKGLVYQLNDLSPVSSFQYPIEGWGITSDQKNIWMTDGSATVYKLDTINFQIIDRFQVMTKNGPVTELNELEYINGELWANVYMQDLIVVINPNTGAVTKVIDFSGLLKPELYTATTDVLNGIAFDSLQNKIYVTGKNWPQLFEIKIKPIN